MLKTRRYDVTEEGPAAVAVEGIDNPRVYHVQRAMIDGLDGVQVVKHEVRGLGDFGLPRYRLPVVVSAAQFDTYTGWFTRLTVLDDADDTPLKRHSLASKLYSLDEAGRLSWVAAQIDDD